MSKHYCKHCGLTFQSEEAATQHLIAIVEAGL